MPKTYREKVTRRPGVDMFTSVHLVLHLHVVLPIHSDTVSLLFSILYHSRCIYGFSRVT